MENSPDPTQSIAFLQHLITRDIAEQNATLRGYQYYCAVADCLGKGISPLFQALWEYDKDPHKLMSFMQKQQSFLYERFSFSVQQWFENKSFSDLHTPEVAGPHSPNDLSFWEEKGCVIVKNIVDRDTSLEMARWVMQQEGMDLDDPQSWSNWGGHPIMREIYDHPILEHTRNSEKARKAFQQVWQYDTVSMNRDRMSINAPVSDPSNFPGPGPRDYIWTFDLVNPLVLRHKGLFVSTMLQKTRGL